VDVPWITDQATRRTWTAHEVQRLYQTVAGIGTPRDSLVNGHRDTLPLAEESRAVDYLALTMLLQERCPQWGRPLRLIRDHLQRLLDRYVPDHRRDEIQQALTEGVRLAQGRL
jgi:hypothetical protein